MRRIATMIAAADERRASADSLTRYKLMNHDCGALSADVLYFELAAVASPTSRRLRVALRSNGELDVSASCGSAQSQAETRPWSRLRAERERGRNELVATSQLDSSRLAAPDSRHPDAKRAH